LPRLLASHRHGQPAPGTGSVLGQGRAAVGAVGEDAMLTLVPEHCREIVLLAAHCDDLPIGAGGTLLELCRARPGLRVAALVLSVLDLLDGRLHDHWERVKLALEVLWRRCEPYLVLASAPLDAH